MPSAAEILSGAKRRVRTAADALMLPALDNVEQSSRDKSRPPTEAEKAWDEMMRLHRAGASQADMDKAKDRFKSLQDQGGQ